jgi:hypothetical protein
VRLCAELWRTYWDAVEGLARIKEPFKKWAIKTADEAADAYFDAVERELASANASNKIWVCFGIGPR